MHREEILERVLSENSAALIARVAFAGRLGGCSTRSGGRFLLVALAGWANRRQLEVIAHLREENRVLKEHLGGRRLSFRDAQRRRLAATGYGLGRRVLADVATLVTPDTILRWHRQLIARKWTTVRKRVGRPGVLQEIRTLTVRMARDNSTWSYRRIQGCTVVSGSASSIIAITLARRDDARWSIRRLGSPMGTLRS